LHDVNLFIFLFFLTFLKKVIYINKCWEASLALPREASRIFRNPDVLTVYHTISFRKILYYIIISPQTRKEKEKMK